MKKKFLVRVLMILLFMSSPLISKGIEVKLSFGLNSGGEANGKWFQTGEYYGLDLLSDQKALWEVDSGLDVTYMFNDHFGLSVGVGYLSSRVDEARMRFIPSPESDWLQGFSYAPQFNAEFTSLSFAGILTFPLLSWLGVYLSSGLDLLFGTLSCETTDWIIEDREDWDEWNHLSYKFRSEVQSFGYHIGSGIEINFSQNVILCLESLYRSVHFDDFNPAYLGVETDTPRLWKWAPNGIINGIMKAQNKEWDSYFFYAERLLGAEEQGDFGYLINEFNLNGFAIRTAIKIKF